MANLALTDAFISIDGNTVDGDGTNLNMAYSADSLDTTSFGDTTRVRIGGLKDWTLQVDFNQDFASGGLDGLMFPLVGTVVAIIIRPDAGVIGVNNPELTGSGLVTSYPPFGNGVGELGTTSITLKAATDLARAEA